MLNGKYSGNTGCILSPNKTILKHFISKHTRETLGQFQNQHLLQVLLPGVRTSLCETFAVEPNAFPL